MKEREFCLKVMLITAFILIPFSSGLFAAETFEEYLEENKGAYQKYDMASDATRAKMKDKWIKRSAEDKKRYEARRKARKERERIRKSTARTYEDYLADNPRAKERYDGAKPEKQAKMKALWETRKGNYLKRVKKTEAIRAKEKEERMARIKEKREEWASLTKEEKRARVKERRSGKK